MVFAVAEIGQMPQVAALLRSLEAQTGWELRVYSEPQHQAIKEIVEQVLRQAKDKNGKRGGGCLGLHLSKCSVYRDTLEVGLRLTNISSSNIGVEDLEAMGLAQRFSELMGGWTLRFEVVERQANPNIGMAVPIKPNQVEILKDLLAGQGWSEKEFVDRHLGGRAIAELTKNEASRWIGQFQTERI